jgi:Family of unknown function (DUF5995)
MNAHINGDLPFALLETWTALGLEPDRESIQYRDFAQVNELLETIEARVKADFATGVLGTVEQALGDTDDAVAMWKVSRARETAWANAEALWALRTYPWSRASSRRLSTASWDSPGEGSCGPCDRRNPPAGVEGRLRSGST